MPREHPLVRRWVRGAQLLRDAYSRSVGHPSRARNGDSTVSPTVVTLVHDHAEKRRRNDENSTADGRRITGTTSRPISPPTHRCAALHDARESGAFDQPVVRPPWGRLGPRRPGYGGSDPVTTPSHGRRGFDDADAAWTAPPVGTTAGVGAGRRGDRSAGARGRVRPVGRVDVLATPGGEGAGNAGRRGNGAASTRCAAHRRRMRPAFRGLAPMMEALPATPGWESRGSTWWTRPWMGRSRSPRRLRGCSDEALLNGEAGWSGLAGTRSAWGFDPTESRPRSARLRSTDAVAEGR